MQFHFQPECQRNFIPNAMKRISFKKFLFALTCQIRDDFWPESKRAHSCSLKSSAATSSGFPLPASGDAADGRGSTRLAFRLRPCPSEDRTPASVADPPVRRQAPSTTILRRSVSPVAALVGVGLGLDPPGGIGVSGAAYGAAFQRAPCRCPHNRMTPPFSEGVGSANENV